MTFHAILVHLAVALGLALISAIVVRLMIAYPILDHPNARSRHRRPTPRGGRPGTLVARTLRMGVVSLPAACSLARAAPLPGVIGPTHDLPAGCIEDAGLDMC